MAHILIIDDNEPFRKVIRNMLQREGHDISEACNGREGIRVYRERPADLVITDMLMPVMTGSKLISTLRDRYPNLKIIAVSGGGRIYQPDNYLDYAKELGVQKVLRKPVLRGELIAAIGAILGEQ